MINLEELDAICKQQLRLQYRWFRKSLRDGHVDTNYAAHKQLNQMLVSFRDSVELRIYIDPNAENYIQAQIKITDYVKLGRDYGLRYGKKLGVMRD